jgi:hypothetical protein
VYDAALRAALEYARLGYSVFPLRPASKIPATPRGCLNATRDEAVIRRWWAATPAYNIGLNAGGLLILDVDCAGLSWLEAIRDELFKTGCPVQKTPRGGLHFVFKYPPGRAYRPSVNLLSRGVDIKCGDGAYIAVTPSVIRLECRGDAGPNAVLRAYSWVRPVVEKAALPLPPDCLIKALDEAEARRCGVVNPTPEAPTTFPEGVRNTGLCAIAGKLRRAGLDDEEIEAALLVVNRRRCCPPLPDDEVRRIARSVGRYPVPTTRSRIIESGIMKAARRRR